MENRNLVIADYFKLRVMLNRTSPVRDQKTEIEFVIIKSGLFTYSLMAALSGDKNAKPIQLCKRDARALWLPANFSGLFYLEDFCATFLRQNLKKYFSDEEQNKILDTLKTELTSLGIPR